MGRLLNGSFIKQRTIQAYLGAKFWSTPDYLEGQVLLTLDTPGICSRHTEDFE